MCLFCFWLPSVTEGLYIKILFYKGRSVFETVLSWREGAWAVPLLRFAGGDKWRRLRGRRIPAASCILHLWNDTEFKTWQMRASRIHLLCCLSTRTSAYEGFWNVVLGFSFFMNKLHFDSCRTRNSQQGLDFTRRDFQRSQKTHRQRLAADRRCAHIGDSLIPCVGGVHKIVLQMFTTRIDSHLLNHNLLNSIILLFNKRVWLKIQHAIAEYTCRCYIHNVRKNDTWLATCVAWITAGSPDAAGAVAYNGFSNVIGCLPPSMAKLSSCGEMIDMTAAAQTKHPGRNAEKNQVNM